MGLNSAWKEKRGPREAVLPLATQVAGCHKSTLGRASEIVVPLCSISVGFPYLKGEKGREGGVECGCLFFFARESPVSPLPDRSPPDCRAV